ncbi:hypothetical protein Y032_0143g2411 [Ancylostoma ceylanicum]|uniref:Uncharacterized protein n=1 Tax=Ancylostoma ceylanicum TaxID=53326 RepID=A0A016T3E4_9BILA|nr:hypothetical protein Y032_0143g2411 [Ancylostoma ceylanicum]
MLYSSSALHYFHQLPCSVAISTTPKSENELLLNWRSEPPRAGRGNNPSGECQDEIDHIVVNRRLCLTDAVVAPKF